MLALKAIMDRRPSYLQTIHETNDRAIELLRIGDKTEAISELKTALLNLGRELDAPLLESSGLGTADDTNCGYLTTVINDPYEDSLDTAIFMRAFRVPQLDGASHQGQCEVTLTLLFNTALAHHLMPSTAARNKAIKLYQQALAVIGNGTAIQITHRVVIAWLAIQNNLIHLHETLGNTHDLLASRHEFLRVYQAVNLATSEGPEPDFFHNRVAQLREANFAPTA